MQTETTPQTQVEAVEALKEVRESLLNIHDRLDMNTEESMVLAYVATEIRYRLQGIGVEIEPHQPL